MDLSERRRRLEQARLYFVTDIGLPPEELDALLGSALAGGVDVIQIRDKAAPERAVLAAATLFREAADRHGALFFVNDDPELALCCGADGVHVGQDDVPVAAARLQSGGELLVGLSTHAPEQLATAASATGEQRPDYVSVGPVWETPTKPGRPAAGIDYVRHAAGRLPAGELPWFAIGAIDPANVESVLAAGARRIVVVRAIRDAEEPGDVARELAGALDRRAEAQTGAAR
jgi:thiamine-phosphate pyrophosphorylase